MTPTSAGFLEMHCSLLIYGKELFYHKKILFKHQMKFSISLFMGNTENLVESTNILVQVASWATLRVEKVRIIFGWDYLSTYSKSPKHMCHPKYASYHNDIELVI